jgi:flagella basal body P-ring formation protein FlgA
MRAPFLLPLLLLVLVVFGLGAPGARAGTVATLRPFGIIDRPEVRLGDLFDGIGAAGARVLGPGPAPGQSITVPAPQLAAIAAQFGVAWQPHSPEDQAVLERPGRPLRRAEVAGALHAALVGAGAPAQFRLLLPDFSPPEVPPGGAVAAEVRALDYDPASGRFSAVILVKASGMDQVEVPVSGRAEPTVRVLVATRALMPGTVIGPADLGPEELPASGIVDAVATDPGQAVGMEVLHPIAPGESVPLEDLARPPLVRRGQLVMIALAINDLALDEQGRALDTGAAGDQVRVLNPLSRAVLEATVVGPGRVRVAPGSAPLSPPAPGLAGAYANAYPNAYPNGYPPGDPELAAQ